MHGFIPARDYSQSRQPEPTFGNCFSFKDPLHKAEHLRIRVYHFAIFWSQSYMYNFDSQQRRVRVRWASYKGVYYSNHSRYSPWLLWHVSEQSLAPPSKLASVYGSKWTLTWREKTKWWRYNLLRFAGTRCKWLGFETMLSGDQFGPNFMALLTIEFCA